MPHDLSFRRYPADALPAELFRDWLDLAKAEPAFGNPFFSPYFMLAASHACPGDCFVTVLSRDGKAVGFFPFQFVNKRLGRAERIGRTLSDYNGVITREPLSAKALSALLAASGIHQYSFDHLETFQQSLGLPGEFIREGCATELPGGFASYWAELERENPKIVKDTLRCEKKIGAEIGPLEFTFHSPDGRDLETLIEVKRAQYKATGVEDSLGEAWTRACLAKLHATRNPDFRGVLSRLTAGDKLISLHFGLLANGILHFWFPIYVPEFSRYSPGRLLFANLLRISDAMGIKSIDQGMGAQKYKTNFTNRTYRLGVGTFRRGTPQCYVLRAQDYLRSRKRNSAAAQGAADEPA